MSLSDILGLQWLEHPRIFNQAIVELRNKSSFTDATLACEGKFYPVHKFILSTCSDYFNAIFEWTPCVNPVVVINNISQHHLEPLLDFMYRGETSVQECHIQDVMKAAECLHIKGLSIRQEDVNFAKSRLKSPEEDLEEPKKKRRKSETIKKPFLKPPLQPESFFGQQASSPIHSSISSTRPTPTPPPTTPIHHTSPHHTPPIHSPSLHSASPHTLSSAASSPASQNQFPAAPLQIPSPKPLVSPMSHFSSQNQQARSIPQYKEPTVASIPSQMQSTSQHHFESYSTQPRDQFTVKEEQPNLVYSLSNPIAISSSSSSSNTIPTSQAPPQYRKYSSSILSDRIQSIQQAGMGGVVIPTLPQMPIVQKLIGIGEELHLEGPVKELEIATEDGSVSLPEILEDWVDMRNLYEAKPQVETYNHETKPVVMDVLPQCSNSESAVNLLHYKEETNDNMYEFTEDLHDDSRTEKMKLLKEKNQRVYSNNGPASRRNNNNELQIDPTASSSDISNASTGPSPTPTPSGELLEAKGPFVCGTCNRICKKKESLTRHMRTHSEFPYTCTVCQHKCKAYKDYILHRKTHATKRCEKCDFVTIRGDALRRHMISTHSEGKATHKCPYSDCAFSTVKSNLLSSHIQANHNHQRREGGEEQ